MLEIKYPRVIWKISLIFIMVLSCTYAHADVIRVDIDGEEDFDNIQAAIDAAVDGDTIIVSPGQYTVTAPITFQGKAITVRSNSGPEQTTIRMSDSPDDTDRASVIVFDNGETDRAILDGFTITGGQGCWSDSFAGIFCQSGGGIFCSNASPTITNCIISGNQTLSQDQSQTVAGGVFLVNSSSIMTRCTINNNSTTYWAGGMYIANGSPTITDCIISKNSVLHEDGQGGGLIINGYGSSCTAVLLRCTISGNSAPHSAGGIQVSSDAEPTFRNCVISNNTTQGGIGGILSSYGSSTTLINCTITRNSCVRIGGGIASGHNGKAIVKNCTITENIAGRHSGGITSYDNSSITVKNCIVYGNSAPSGPEIGLDYEYYKTPTSMNISYSDIKGGLSAAHIGQSTTLTWGEGNIDSDPLFADPDNSDFHLKSQAGRWNSFTFDESWIIDDVSSPCIDAGDPNSPVANELFPNGGRINMGAYGGTIEAGKSPSGFHAKYSGGTGEPNDPYQIATADDLMLLSDSPEDNDKHLILTADIDLNPNLPGRKVFNDAVICRGWPGFQGVFEGNGHTISNLTIIGRGGLGLFGHIEYKAEVRNLGIVDANISGSEIDVGGIASSNAGSISSSFCTGRIEGTDYVGGMVGWNEGGSIAMSYCIATVSGEEIVGGIVGGNIGSVTTSYSNSTVNGDWAIGGLVGKNGSTGQMGYTSGGGVLNCYSLGAVTGNEMVGGLVGFHYSGHIDMSYSTGLVTGNEDVGGLVGDDGRIESQYQPLFGPIFGGSTTASFWDMETSGQSISDGGVGKTTAEMQDINTYINEGWDFFGQAGGPHDIWTEPEGGGYPVLFWQVPPEFGLPDFAGGKGVPDDPYMIATAEELNAIGHNPRLMNSHFRLVDDLDLTDMNFYSIGSSEYPYRGVFDGNNHVIANLKTVFINYLGDLAEVKNLGIVDANIISSDSYIGGLVGFNSKGDIINCYIGGTVEGRGQVGGLVGHNENGSINVCYSGCIVSGDGHVGGLVGYNRGSITTCYSIGAVNGDRDVGGLVGYNGGSITACHSNGDVIGTEFYAGGIAGENSGTITISYSSGDVSGNNNIGGLAGRNDNGSIVASYSSGTVSGNSRVGGLVGYNNARIITCYSTGIVTGNEYLGGLVGRSHVENGVAINCVWDIQTSDLKISDGGMGLSSAEMMDPEMLGLNGFANDPNWVLDAGRDYPRLVWENTDGQIVPAPVVEWLDGQGTELIPYRIDTADQLILLSRASGLWDKYFILDADIDLSPDLPGGQIFNQSIIPNFAGVFDGNYHTISHLTIEGRNRILGLFGWLQPESEIRNLGVTELIMMLGSNLDTENFTGGLAGYNKGSINNCYSTGTITGSENVGGLVGFNDNGIINGCSSNCTTSGSSKVGGLVGYNSGEITVSHCAGTVSGSTTSAGGLVGNNNYHGTITASYSTTSVSGNSSVGGLAGGNSGGITMSYSTGTVHGGGWSVGGFVGVNSGTITMSYSIGTVLGSGWAVGGFVGNNWSNACIASSFWDIQTSGLFKMCGAQSPEAAECDNSCGKTTATMQTVSTFLDAGWDFVDETDNGTEDIWWIDEGQDYPRLWWEHNE